MKKLLVILPLLAGCSTDGDCSVGVALATCKPGTTGYSHFQAFKKAGLIGSGPVSAYRPATTYVMPDTAQRTYATAPPVTPVTGNPCGMMSCPNPPAPRPVYVPIAPGNPLNAGLNANGSVQ